MPAIIHIFKTLYTHIAAAHARVASSVISNHNVTVLPQLAVVLLDLITRVSKLLHSYTPIQTANH
jgi:hypothetical protein